MSLLALILYAVINVSMVLYYLRGKELFYQFPFWAGIIGLGWFFPQAIGGYAFISQFPENAYTDGMIFASLCTGALWLGFAKTTAAVPSKTSWLDTHFDIPKLYWISAAFCVAGFYFQWKLWSLPEEMLAQGQWSGATVKYQFLGNVFKFGFLTLWLIYLVEGKLVNPRLLLFVLPSLMLLFSAVLLRGRRGMMMDLVAYLFVSLWLVRRIGVPRLLLVLGLIAGLTLVNGIGTYRAIMMSKKDASLSERLAEAASADYLSQSSKALHRSGSEFKNYIFYRQVYAETGNYDWGSKHWNKMIHNFVPAQIVGRATKESLMLKHLKEEKPQIIAHELYGHKYKTGSTSTGYSDAFGSFGWFGFIKFLWVGGVMGILYRHARGGHFLGQLLYVYALGIAMHSISHSTHRFLVSMWIYFFMLVYPGLYWARYRGNRSVATVSS